MHENGRPRGRPHLFVCNIKAFHHSILRFLAKNPGSVTDPLIPPSTGAVPFTAP